MRIDEYKVLSECIEKGIDYGYMRAHKYTDSPTDEGIKDAIHDAVMNEVCEYFHFNEHQQENTDSAALVRLKKKILFHYTEHHQEP